MDPTQIEKEVQRSIRNWTEAPHPFRHEAFVTEGAAQLITHTIINIESDPSSAWKDIDKDVAQKYALSLLPNILNDISRHYRTKRFGGRITSWEILHALSRTLDNWCFIPKDI